MAMNIWQSMGCPRVWVRGLQVVLNPGDLRNEALTRWEPQGQE